MERDELLAALLAATAAFFTAETALRLKDRNEAKNRYLRERWNIERSWEQFDSLSGWELVPGYTSDDLRINRHGFRGPEFVHAKTQRVICLGDSITFGPAGEKNTYPAALQEALSKEKLSLPAEVINAGINAQSTYNMLFRVKRILRYNPKVVIVMAGWNDLFLEDIRAYRDNRRPFSSYWHVEDGKCIRSHLLNRITTRKKAPEKNIALSYTPDEFIPFNFEYNLTKIISRITCSGVKAALVTLPKLVPDDPENLTPAAKRKVLLPEYIDAGDLDAFLKVYKAYDGSIKRVAENQSIPLFDAEAHMNEQKRPRSTFFDDTAHLTRQGTKLLGKFIASRLMDEGIVA